MFQAYWDDSGTHAQSPVAIAACYISTKRGWDSFVEEYDIIRSSEGFDCFHMADFAASHDPTKKPWSDWDHVKRTRAYRRIAEAINRNKRIGFGFAVPKEGFDRLLAPLPDRLKDDIGRDSYTFAVRCLMGAIQRWREGSLLTKTSMQYVFDQGGSSEEEIGVMWKEIRRIQEPYARYGMTSGGVSFQNRCEFKPLQAADILAWQMNSHMRNVIMAGKNDVDDIHPRFKLLRLDQSVDLYFMDEAQLDNHFKRTLTRKGYL